MSGLKMRPFLFASPTMLLRLPLGPIVTLRKSCVSVALKFQSRIILNDLIVIYFDIDCVYCLIVLITGLFLCSISINICRAERELALLIIWKINFKGKIITIMELFSSLSIFVSLISRTGYVRYIGLSNTHLMKVYHKLIWNYLLLYFVYG